MARPGGTIYGLLHSNYTGESWGKLHVLLYGCFVEKHFALLSLNHLLPFPEQISITVRCFVVRSSPSVLWLETLNHLPAFGTCVAKNSNSI